VTVVQDEGGPLPVVGADAPARVLTVLLDADSTRLAPFADRVAEGLDPSVASTSVRLGPGEADTRFARVLDVADRADLVVLAVAEGGLDARQRAVAERLLASAVPTALVALGPPALAAGLPRADAFVVAYGSAEPEQRAAAEAVAGQVEVGGRLPVPVAGLWAAGAGAHVRQQALRLGTPEEAGLDRATVDRVDAVVRRAVRDGAFPGAAVAVGRDGVLVRLGGYGALTPGGAPATATTAYDLASLTKVVGTTAAVMRLVEAGEVDLDAPVREYLPGYRPVGGTPTVRQLLSHSAGHRPFYPFYARGVLDREAVLDFVYRDTLSYRPGARSRYSDFDMIVLGEVVAAVTDRPLDEALSRLVFGPLGMERTGFRAPGTVDPTAAPTERDRVWRGRTLQGEVHDEAASVLGGVAGHAGLFSTAEDLSRFAFLLASGGEAYGARLFRPSTLDRFTERVRLRSTYPTGLGWMLQATGRGYSSAGSVFGPRSFGHTGFTGTSIWVDPDQGLFVVLLTNRVHPTRRNRKIRSVRADLADAVAGSVRAPSGEPLRALFDPVPADLAAR
jgi:CubicO group peptidase (beta-lactamase class C family)